jgi:hypothetical protein
VCLAIVAGGFLLAAFDAPIFDLLQHAPVFSSIKRAYYIVCVIWAMAILSAMAFERWFEGDVRSRWLVLSVGVALAINTVLYLIYAFFGGLIHQMRFDPYLGRQMAELWAAQTAVLILLGLGCVWKRPRIWMALLTVVLAADLLTAGRGMNPTQPRSYMYPKTQLTDFLQTLPRPGRVGLAEGMILRGFMIPYGVEEVLGYDAVYPERITRFQQTLLTNVWTAMEPVYNIGYYLNDPRGVGIAHEAVFPLKEPGRFERVAALDGLEVYRNNRALPRAFLVGRGRVVENRDRLFEAMAEPGFDPAKEVLLESSPSRPLPQGAGDAPGTARITDYRSTRIAVEVDATADSILVLGDAYYPGWRATMDGVAAPIFPAYYAFRGVQIPAGRHEVVFSYFPLSLRIGLVLSIATLLTVAVVSVAMFAAPRIARRRQLSA